MVDVIFIQNFFIALALGALIGVEREYAHYKNRGHMIAGIRTFPLIALFGALSAYLGERISVWILVVGIFLTGILILVSYSLINKTHRKFVGTTTEVAGFLTFFIGALSYYGETFFAMMLAISITIILYARSVLHDFAAHIKKEEMADTLKFAVIAFVILPFLPNKGYGPYELFNPFLIWSMVVFVCGIGFVGYVLMKWKGEKGLELTALLGGLVSSTALTSNFAQKSKKKVNLSYALAVGVIIANGVMFIRLLLEIFALNPILFVEIFPIFAILAGATALIAYILWKRGKKAKDSKVELGSPFALAPALKFAIIFTLALALIKLSNIYFSPKGIYFVSFLSGLADADAITLSLSQLAGGSVSMLVAKKSILIAALSNVASKGAIAVWLGGSAFRKIVLSSFIPIILLGIILLFVF